MPPPGRSQAGLIAALLQARGAKLARAQAAGRLSPAGKTERQARQKKRIEALAQRQFAGAR